FFGPRFGFGNFYGYRFGGPAIYPYGIGNWANPVVGLNQGGAYLVPGPVPYCGFGVNLGNGLTYGVNTGVVSLTFLNAGYLGYPAYGGAYTTYGGNPNAFMHGPHRNAGAFAGPAIAPVNAVGPLGPVEPGPNAVLNDALREEADRWRAPINLGDAGPLPAADRAPDERELAAALGDERAGDLAFAELNYRRALSHYRRAIAAAPTRGDAFYRSAFARLALGQFAAASEDLRRAVELNPTLPQAGPSLRELFGPEHSIARTAALGGIADHAREDVRDADRLFLLGATMHANGDDRSREIFEAAWRLTGGRPHLRPYLDPVRITPLAPDDAGPTGETLPGTTTEPEASPVPAPIESLLSAPEEPAV
ncbi:MAG: hypothetical protein AAF907_17070, partial [Planctomycetota bacterium]